jgi:hypothetical protein
MVRDFHPRGLPLGRVQSDSRDENRPPVEVPARRSVGVDTESRSTKGSDLDKSENHRGEILNGLRRFAAIAEHAAMKEYGS